MCVCVCVFIIKQKSNQCENKVTSKYLTGESCMREDGKKSKENSQVSQICYRMNKVSMTLFMKTAFKITVHS